jgi:hypothetical protein
MSLQPATPAPLNPTAMIHCLLAIRVDAIVVQADNRNNGNALANHQ